MTNLRAKNIILKDRKWIKRKLKYKTKGILFEILLYLVALKDIIESIIKRYHNRGG